MSIRRLEVEIPKFLEGVLIKDLNENEVICEHCGGTGLEIRDNVYGIDGEDGFKYKQQSLSFCSYCYNGIREKCEFCGDLLPKGYRVCDCEGYKKYKEDERIKVEKERYDKAQKMTYEEYIEKYPDYMFFCADNETYYSDIDELEDDYLLAKLDMPEYVYGTHKQTINIDIDSAIENACDDLYDEAYNNLKGLDELYRAIDDFNNLNKDNTASYYPNYSLVVLLGK